MEFVTFVFFFFLRNNIPQKIKKSMTDMRHAPMDATRQPWNSKSFPNTVLRVIRSEATAITPIINNSIINEIFRGIKHL